MNGTFVLKIIDICKNIIHYLEHMQLFLIYWSELYEQVI